MNKRILELLFFYLNIIIFLVIYNFQCLIRAPFFSSSDCLQSGFGSPKDLYIFLLEIAFQVYILIVLHLWHVRKIHLFWVVFISILAYEIFYFSSIPYPISKSILLEISFIFNVMFIVLVIYKMIISQSKSSN